MPQNGRLPGSVLARIPGTGPYGAPVLRRDAAVAYNAMDRESRRRFGVSLGLHESVVGRAYRNINRQYLATRTYGRNAATPGQSNHGWGLAVDLMNRQQIRVVSKIGAKYGFSKRCSDASWEAWHHRWNPRCTGATFKPKPRFRVLRYRSRGTRVRWVQRRLRDKGYLSVRASGFYGVATRRAVVRFQRKNGVRADGVVGPATWGALR